MRRDGIRRPGLRGRALIILTTVAVGLLAAVGVGIAAVANVGPFGNTEVGQTTAQGTLLPSNQWVTPLGTRILDNDARLVSSSISPDGKYLAALGWNNFSGYLTIVNLQTQKIVQQQALVTGPSGNQDYSVAADGPLWSPDGSTLWVPQSAYLDRFSFDESTGQASETATILLCGQPATASACTYGPTNAQGAYLPSGMALSPNGSTLYVALNGANALGVIDTGTNTLSTMIPVGNAPRQVVLTDGGQDAYVSNEGGAPAQAGQFTNLSDGTPIVSNKSTGAASSGTVSVVDLGSGSETK
jgi:YVTN family beta-propeller protein